MTEENNLEVYKIKIEGGIEAEKIEVNQSISRQTALKVLTLLLGGADKFANIGGSKENDFLPAINAGDIPDPKIFMATKKPASDVERITCLAFYLSIYKGITQYKTRELTDLNIEAAQPKFSNATVAARNAVQQQYLVGAGGGRKQITTVGEAIVMALPDRAKVKEALEQNARANRKKRTKKPKKNSSD